MRRVLAVAFIAILVPLAVVVVANVVNDAGETNAGVTWRSPRCC
jgi:hypothetical protein